MPTMSQTTGNLCIVLHAHLPYVLNHGVHPHGEAWLFEAAAETYLPLLDVIGEVALLRARPALTVGLTPVLLEQLAQDHFKAGFVVYLKERIRRATADIHEFEKASDPHRAGLARRWIDFYTRQLEHFERINRNIPGEFARRAHEGHIQILTSSATHAYLPLLLNDQSIAAQLACGTSTTRRHLGLSPQGIWLPECAFRPHEPKWMPAVLYDKPRDRIGLEHFITAAGLNHFFVDAHMLQHGEPLGTVQAGRFESTVPPQLYWDIRRGWRNPLEPVGVASEPSMPHCYALARHPKASEQVWSSIVGYPGAAEYLEFHRHHGPGGLRYHKVTGLKIPSDEKLIYNPHDIPAKTHEHVTHFCNTVRQVLSEYQKQTGRIGTLLAPFDAELFGHWWFEGVAFLRDVLLTLWHDPEVNLITSQEVLQLHPPDKVMRLPDGSWGEEGKHKVWLNDQTRWMWEVEYRAENRLLSMIRALPWQTNPAVRSMLERTARQLLLLQASDWPFVVHSKGAVDYGIIRFSGHATRFDRAAQMAGQLAGGTPLSAVQQSQVEEMDRHDIIFSQIDLNWWLP